MSDALSTVPLFPLRTVLFPDGPLPLRIFEARYIDMISNCLKTEQPFGVVLIREGSEVGPARTFNLGTLAYITDWYQGSDGLLGVTAIGERRFRLKSAKRQADGLNTGEIEILPAPEPVAMPGEFAPLVEILSGVLDNLGKLYESLERRFDDAGWVSYRFAEILPITPEDKQVILEVEDPIERLVLVSRVLREVRGNEEPGKA